MKVNYKYIFIFFSVVLMGSLLSTPALAQYESDLSGNEIRDLSLYPEYNPSNEDKPLIYEHEHRGSNRASRDSAHTKSAMPAVGGKGRATDSVKASSANKEDDALSFNFLYYIIQKFKISDLVDE